MEPKVDCVVYSPLTNQHKPYKFNGKRYNANELIAMGKEKEMLLAVINYK